MKLLGDGYCRFARFYAGEDSKGTANQEACNLLCMSEKECTFAAYINTHYLQACFRYNSTSCVLDVSSANKIAYTTYYKDPGAFQGMFCFFVIIGTLITINFRLINC